MFLHFHLSWWRQLHSVPQWILSFVAASVSTGDSRSGSRFCPHNSHPRICSHLRNGAFEGVPKSPCLSVNVKDTPFLVTHRVMGSFYDTASPIASQPATQGGPSYFYCSKSKQPKLLKKKSSFFFHHTLLCRPRW